MNNVVLIGRLTKDVELRRTNSGKAVASFTLAVNKDFKNEQGNYDADFIDCIAFEQRAETISKYVHKGDRFGVLGRISTRTFDKQDGSKGYATEVIVEGFEFLESKKDKSPDAEFEGFEPIDDDELPFN